MFEKITEHLESQKTEIEDLRAQLLEANRQAIQGNQSASTDLEKVLEEERQAAETDRADLLSQISLLIEASSQKQASRLKGRVDTVTSDLKTSGENLHKATHKYQEGMDKWADKESRLMEEVVSSRDAIKGRMQEDWEVSCENISITRRGFSQSSRSSNNATNLFKSLPKLFIKKRFASLMSKYSRWPFRWKRWMTLLAEPDLKTDLIMSLIWLI
jgi:exonuclease VII large subunit